MSDTATLPSHIGLILDGNRRWAKSKGLATVEGHRKGMDALRDVSFHAFEQGITYITAYVFSVENWQRAEEEVSYLMNLTIKAIEKYLDEYHKRGIRLLMLGRHEGVRKSVLDAITRAEQKTADNTKGTLALCFNYGGREEIVDAVKTMMVDGVDYDDITPERFQKYLYHPELPDMDLLIRTSGEERTSGFMLYRAAYAELLFVDTLWPDFTVKDFDAAVTTYIERERRFGA